MTRLVCTLLAALLLAACRCDGPAEPSGPDEEPDSAATPAEPEATGGSATPEHTTGIDELDSLEEQIAADLLAAIDADDPDGVADALSRLGRALGQLRGGTYTEALVSSVRWFCSGEQAGLRARIDARRVIAALEVMLDVRDGAAIDRLRQSYEAGVAGDRFTAASRLALSWSNAAATIQHGGVPCEVTVNGSAVRGDSTLVPFGSNTIACAGADPFLFVATRLVHTARWTPDGILVADD